MVLGLVSIRETPSKETKKPNKTQNMSIIASYQVRAAKSMLRWSGSDLAQRAGVSLSTIRRVEAAEDVPDAQTIRTLIAIKKAFEEAGIEFVGTPEDRTGVRLGRLVKSNLKLLNRSALVVLGQKPASLRQVKMP